MGIFTLKPTAFGKSSYNCDFESVASASIVSPNYIPTMLLLIEKSLPKSWAHNEQPRSEIFDGR